MGTIFEPKLLCKDNPGENIWSKVKNQAKQEQEQSKSRKL